MNVQELTKRPPLNLGPMGGTPEDLWESAQRLVATFGKIAGVGDIKLLPSSAGGSTDCKSYVRLNPQDPEMYLVAEHEVSHIVFGSDVIAATIFARKRAQRLLEGAGLPSNEESLRLPLERVIHFLWNILEDWRICLLWSELYPGGGELLQQRWKDICTYEVSVRARQDLVAYLACVAAGAAPDNVPPEFEKCAKHIEWAMNMVLGVDAYTCLGISGLLVDRLADELIPKQEPQPPPMLGGGGGSSEEDEDDSDGGGSGDSDDEDEEEEKAKPKIQAASKKRGRNPQQAAKQRQQMQAENELKVQALLKVAPSMGEDSPDGIGEDDMDVPSSSRVTPDASIMAKVSRIEKAINGDEDAIDELREKGKEEMEARLEQARKLMSMPQMSDADVQAERFLAAFSLASIPGSIVTPALPLPPTSRQGLLMKKELEKIRMKRKFQLSEEGDDVDVESYIEAAANNELHEDPRVFLKIRKESGMELLVLGDVSGSMLGPGLELLDQAMSDIDFATKPEIKVLQWAFSDEVYVFDKLGSFRGVPNIRHGCTAIVQSLDAAFEWAKNSKSQRAIILATDGFPTTCRGRNSVGDPTKDMRNVLSDIHKAGITLSVLCYGGEGTRSHYDAAFGAGGYGLFDNKQGLSQGLLQTARALVINHIKKSTR